MRRITCHNHQLFRADTVIGDEPDAPCRVCLRVVFNDRQNLCTNLLTLLGAQGIVVRLFLRLSKIGDPNILRLFEVCCRDSQDRICKEEDGIVSRLWQLYPEVLELKMTEAALAHFTQKVLLEGLRAHNNNVLLRRCKESFGRCNRSTGLSGPEAMVDEDSTVGCRVAHIVADELLIFIEFVVLVHLHRIGQDVGRILQFNELGESAPSLRDILRGDGCFSIL